MESKNSVNNLSEFLNLLSRYQEQFSSSAHGTDFIFRGMANEQWSLVPGIFREYLEPQKPKNGTKAEMIGYVYLRKPWYENKILNHFKKEASVFLPQMSQAGDLEWLQYAQHYGVPTRLLDFTTNPLISLYFCCKSEENQNGAIWIVQAVNLEEWSNNDPFVEELLPYYTRQDAIQSALHDMIDSDTDRDEREREFGNPYMERPILFIPPYIDSRMAAQASRFLIWGSDHRPLDSMIKPENMMNLRPDGVKLTKESDQSFLSKIIIPQAAKRKLLRELDTVNVNEKSVFPGLDAIGHYIEQYYRNKVDDICEAF